ncbi:hypothetical protein AVEN_74404-1 [Araneus ventricosus]|uniref:Uncharacterized protein n=1 Tax=Araneus ventricosus TaxID=182803 RepID=A0A4Y2J767_ARAVE|nr:hypothetical protein AVEN_74404-1 [Araneus ventricosus]
MGPCDDLPAKPELLHWGTMRRARRDLVTRLCRASVNSAIKEHGVMCRLTATAFDENDPSVRTLIEKMFRRERKIKRKHSIINSLLFEKNFAVSQDRTYYENSSKNACLSFASYDGEEVKYAKSTS